jgi:hypothetical protein
MMTELPFLGIFLMPSWHFFFNVQSWGNLSDETCAAIYKELTEADWSNGFFNHPTVSFTSLSRFLTSCWLRLA